MSTPDRHPQEPALPFLDFAPVPVRARRDGWTAETQRGFVLHLARGMGVEGAARAVGRSRQSAYALRERDGAEGFAAAWDAAVVFAAKARSLRGVDRDLADLLAGPVPAMLVPRFYRGRLMGYALREDMSGLIAALRRLDRMAGT